MEREFCQDSDGGKVRTRLFAEVLGFFKDDLVGLPLVGVGLWEADMSEDAVDELTCHLGCVLGVVVEGGDYGEDGGSRVGGELHVAKVDAVEGRFADAEDKRATFFETDVGGALDEV